MEFKETTSSLEKYEYHMGSDSKKIVLNFHTRNITNCQSFRSPNFFHLLLSYDMFSNRLCLPMISSLQVSNSIRQVGMGCKHCVFRLGRSSFSCKFVVIKRWMNEPSIRKTHTMYVSTTTSIRVNNMPYQSSLDFHRCPHACTQFRHSS